jgi:ParB-like chromosome segregation protein Spo0J
MSETTMLAVSPTGGDISINIAFADEPMKIHEVAKAFPTLPAKELAEIAADIEKNGITVPILLNKAGDTIIDGRTRWTIALDLGLRKSQVPVERFMGTDEEIPSVIISRNLFRRHLTDKQRTALVSKLLGPQWQKEAAERKAKSQFATRENTVPAKSGQPPSTEGSDDLVLKSTEPEESDEPIAFGETATRIAAAAKTTPYQARQAEHLRKHDPNALDDVIKGKPIKKRGTTKTDPFDKQVWKRWDSWLHY